MIERTPDTEYFCKLRDFVCRDIFAPGISYDSLLFALFKRPFEFLLPRDANRYNDGLAFRNCYDNHGDYSKLAPCSVLEMMIALAVRCEETIMTNPEKGDRTLQWFWGMVRSLGLWGMTDDCFSQAVVDYILDRFISREYNPDGSGGLFTIPNCNRDLRRVEIWTQLCWFLDSIE